MNIILKSRVISNSTAKVRTQSETDPKQRKSTRYEAKKIEINQTHNEKHKCQLDSNRASGRSGQMRVKADKTDPIQNSAVNHKNISSVLLYRMLITQTSKGHFQGGLHF